MSMNLSPVPRPRYDVRPYGNTVPLTLRDNSTFLLQLEEIKRYLRADLGPHLDKELKALGDEFNRVANELIDSVLQSSIELQDPVISQLAMDPESFFFRVFENKLTGIIREDPDDEGTYVIRQPEPPASGVRPDPTDPGFFQ